MVEGGRTLAVLCLLTTFLAVGGLSVTPVASDETSEKELVPNGDAEKDSGWESYNCGSAALPKLNERTSVDKHGGEYSRHIIIEAGSHEWPGVKSPSFSTETSKTYQVRFWYKTASGTFSVMMRNGASNDYVNFTTETFSPNHIMLDATRKDLVWREFTGVYAEKSGGNSAYLCFVAAGPATEFYVDDVSVRNVDLSAESVLRSWRKLFTQKQYLCWTKSPWDKLSRMSHAPVSVKECKEIGLAMGENEYESASFVLTDFSDRTLEFAVSVKDAGIRVTLREAVWITSRSGNEINDALPLLEGKLSIPSGESREIWLTLYSKGVKPGDYSPQILIKPQGLPASSVNLKVKVYPVSLPEDKPIYTSYWEYLVPEWTTPELAKALVENMKQHYVNAPVVHPWPLRIQLDAEGRPKQSFAELDAVLDYYRQLNPKMVLLNLAAENYLEKMPGFFSDEWKALFKSWLTGLVSHLKEKGWGYERFALYPYDERLDQPVHKMARLIKETDAKILVYANNTGTHSQAEAIAPCVDIWCPFLYDYLNMGVYGPNSEKNLDQKLLSKDARLFWTYANPLSGLPQESSPYADYRLAVWRAWQAGMSGFGYWIYSYKTHWNSYKNDDGENWAVVYLANAKDAPAGISKKEPVVTGKRWEATREGVEDYVYLRLLKDTIGRAGRKVSPELLNEANRILAESPKAVLSDPRNSGLADAAKERILKVLTRLSKALNLQEQDRPDPRDVGHLRWRHGQLHVVSAGGGFSKVCAATEWCAAE